MKAWATPFSVRILIISYYIIKVIENLIILVILVDEKIEVNDDYESDATNSSYEIVSTPLEPVQFHFDMNQVCVTPDGELCHVKERDLVFEDEEF